MTAVIEITLPIFALILLGNLLARAGFLETADLDTLGKVTLNVALPALVFEAIRSGQLARMIDAGYMATYVIATLTTMLLAVLLLTMTGARGTSRMVGALGVCSSNSGYIGYPIIALTYPDVAGVVLAMQVLIESIFAIPLALILMESAHSPSRSVKLRAVLTVAGGVLRRPMILAVPAGILANSVGPHAGNLDKPAEMLAAMAGPMALLYIGGVLAQTRLVGIDHARAGIIVSAKLIAMPALAFLAIQILPGLGFPAVQESLRMPLVLSAAMPMMGAFPVFAQEYAQQKVASVSLAVATIISFFSISLLLGVVAQPAEGMDAPIGACASRSLSCDPP